MKRKVIGVCIAVAVVLTALLLSGRTTTFSPEETVDRHFELMGIEDAQYLGLKPKFLNTEEEFWYYESEAAGMCFWFEPDTGRLSMAETDDNSVQEESAAYAELSNEAHMEYALEYAELCAAADLIGELRVEYAPEEDDWQKDYIFAEYYGDIPTGTKIAVSCGQNGSVSYVILNYGSLFEAAAFGRYQLKNGDDFIGEDAAIQIAADQVDQIGGKYKRTEEAPEVVMQAFEADLFYKVTYQTESADGWVRKYAIQVDAYDGEILETAYTMGSLKTE